MLRGLLMLGERAIRAETPSSRRSRPCRRRAPPCSSPPPLAAAIIAIDGSSRCAWVWGTRRCRRVRRRCHRRQSTPPPCFPPLPVSLTRGPCLSVADARSGSQLGLSRVLGRASVCSRAAVPSGRSNNCGCDLFLILFALLFYSFVLVFKNLYCLVYRSKC